MFRLRFMSVLLASALLTAACSPAATTVPADPLPTADAASAAPAATAVVDAQPAATAVVDAQPAANAPAFASLPLTNVRTGETFTLADFAGTTVLVHPMATWCTNCRASQRNLLDNVLPSLDAQQFAVISLSVENDLDNADLASYADDNGFPWTFAIASPDLIAALTARFGGSVIVPPAQPHFFVRPDGSVTALMTGNPSPADYITLFNNVAAGSV